MRYNDRIQDYKGVKLQLIVYSEKHFARLQAKRFLILSPTNRPSGQNLWIPNKFLLPDGTIDPKKNLDWLFIKRQNQHKIELARQAK